MTHATKEPRQDVAPGGGAAPAPEREPESAPSRLWAAISPRNIGAIYIWIAIVVLFCLISPDRFATGQTSKTILNQYAITGMVALSLVVPLAAGLYDLSIGYVVSFSGVFVAWLLRETSLSPVEAALITAAACAAFGLINAFVVVGLGVNSFIATLGTGGILASVVLAISNNETIVGRVGEGYTGLATTDVAGITLPVFLLLAMTLILAYVLSRTAVGRSLYAVGFDEEAARLTGVRTDRLSTLAFVTSSVIAGFAGMVLAARLSSGTPTAGPGYLIPAFSAAFLGATQFRGGRFNPWGTVTAVLLLGTGDVGLLLSGGPIWTPQLFEGVALISAVALTDFGRSAVSRRISELRARRAARAATAVTGERVS